MKDPCSSISQLLERYFDREVTDRERALVESHLLDCLNCHERLKLLEGLREAIKNPVDEALKEETFPWVWERIERGIRLERRPSWHESFRSWLALFPFFRKKVWIPAVATILVLFFVTAQIFFKKFPSYSGASVVEYVESETHNVMVYDLEKAKVTVIWVFEEPEEETFSS
jgi:anti-sigma factor RsiW